MPSSAPRRWRGGAMGTSRPTAKPHEGCGRRGHGARAGVMAGEYCGGNGAVPRLAAGGATGRRALRGYEGRTETPPQNSQRVLLAKPRTAAVSHRGQWRSGASREARRPSIAPYRNGTRAWSAARERCGVCGMLSHAPRRWRGGAMGTSRPTAKPHKGRGRGEGARTATGRAARERGEGGARARTRGCEDARGRGRAGAGMDRKVVKK